MSGTDESAETEAAASGEAAPATKKKPIGLIMGLAGVAVGIAAGLFVVGPRLAGSKAPASAEASAEAPEGEAAKPGRVYQLENLIVNPAGSMGTRFVMATVAFAVADDKAQKAISEHEVELRDMVTTLLGRLPLDSLTQPGARDMLKARIAELAAPVIGIRTPLKVYLPQFVIQ
jgi:flagellar FliL protein